ncbi:MAG: hypothetical protein GY715_12415 [Planctomycetes bacterium]|nr:hypothetical protein [Planctomycetota bacterium]
MTRRGGILLEVLLSLALFVAAAAFALGATRSVVGTLDRSRREALAVDLARSRLAELEAGIVTLAELRDDAEGLSRAGSVEAFGEEADDGGRRWEIDVTTERTEFTGLVLVELTVREAPDEAVNDPSRIVECTLRQLVALREGDDEAWEADELLRDLPEADE